MKAKQWTLLLVLLVAIVFGITYATMFVGRGQNKPRPDGKDSDKRAGSEKANSSSNRNENLQLSFRSVQFPDPLEAYVKRYVTEFGGAGHHDFWFSNNNSEEVEVGWASASCASCSAVEICLAPESWRKDFGVWATQWLGAAAANTPASAGVLCAAVDDRIHAFMDSANGKRALKMGDKAGVAIPPGRFGFLRMQWTVPLNIDPQKSNVLSLQLWYQDARLASTLLQVGQVYAQPFLSSPSQIDMGELRQGDTASQEILVWSVIHPEFAVEVKSSAEPFLRCTNVEPLTAEELVALREDKKVLGRILCGYRLHVNARERFGDAANDRADIGAFDHSLTIWPVLAGKRQQELRARVQGFVRGDVVVDGIERNVVLETFRVRDGTKRELTLSSDRPNLDLKVDERTSPFLNARIEKVAGTRSRSQWKLFLEIPPNRISGNFPRDPDFRDSAIYLKIDGEKARRIRIPVVGQATQ